MASSFAIGGASELVRVAVTLILKDEGFGLPSTPASSARVTAEKLLEWSSQQENKPVWEAFAEQLVSDLNRCFEEPWSRSMRQAREVMWERLFKLRSSQYFRDLWAKCLLDAIGCEPACPIFYQFVTDAVIEVLVKRNFPVSEVDSSATSEASLDFEEQNALRYTAGYVMRNLKKKIRQSAHPLKEELLFCLSELAESHEESDESATWINAIDRGRLVHIDDHQYHLFVAMELALRKHLSSKRASELLASKATQDVIDDGDVQFYWSMLSANWEEDDGQTLLHMLVTRWTTLRGFSFASALMEKYKQKACKNVQKSKGVRKQLQTPGPST